MGFRSSRRRAWTSAGWALRTSASRLSGWPERGRINKSTNSSPGDYHLPTLQNTGRQPDLNHGWNSRRRDANRLDHTNLSTALSLLRTQCHPSFHRVGWGETGRNSLPRIGRPEKDELIPEQTMVTYCWHRSINMLRSVQKSFNIIDLIRNQSVCSYLIT